MEFPRSSVIKSADYDPETRALEVVFRTGRQYVYFAVPEYIFDALVTAPSAGEYFNTNIRDHYETRERH
jgi:lysyl-tRNA synthetase class 2